MRLKIIFAYTAAVLATVVAVGTFLGMDYLSHKLVNGTGLKISPWYTGGEIVNTVDHAQFKTLQHRAVYDSLIGRKTEGFVQIDFAPSAALPDKISEDIDFDLDGAADFRIEYDTKANTAVLTPFDSRVLSLDGCYKLKERRAVRIKLDNK